MSKDKLTEVKGKRIGTFQVGDIEYTIKAEDYDSLPDDLPEAFVLNAVKQVAMIRCTSQGDVKATDLEENNKMLRKQGINEEDSPIPRFHGTVLLVDGTNVAYRSKFALSTHNKGQDTSVVFGVLRSIIYEMGLVDDIMGVIVAWDEFYPDFRKEAVPTYKQGRTSKKGWSDEEKKDFYRQLDLLHETLPQFGIVSVKKPHCEADDIIAGACKLIHPDIRKIVVSSDADMMQLVNYHCHLKVHGAQELITQDNFELASGGVTRQDYLMYKAMVGDSSDNIPGVKGIGDATAKKLLADYDCTYEELYWNAISDDTDLAKGVASKLAMCPVEEFEKILTCIRLDIDRVGAKWETVIGIKTWQPYDKFAIKKFLAEQAIKKLDTADVVSQVKKIQGLGRWILPDVKTPVGYVKKYPITEIGQ